MNAPLQRTTDLGFFAPTTLAERELVMTQYDEFLARRNGTYDANGNTLAHREAMLQDHVDNMVFHPEALDQRVFNALYANFKKCPELTRPMNIALAFAKLNAGEAYGVEVTKKVRIRQLGEAPPVHKLVELSVMREEEYHTKTLVGATAAFGLDVEGAFTPNVYLKTLIFGVAYAPTVLHHPILLAAEVAGLYTFNWMLNSLSRLLPDQPQLRESLEARLIDVLIDEVGHVMYNRLSVGPIGTAMARNMVGSVAKALPRITPELGTLGLTDADMRKIHTFSIHDLPEQVVRAAFYEQ